MSRTFAPEIIGTDAHLDALDELRTRGDVVELAGYPRRTFVVVGHAALTVLASSPALSSRWGTGLVDAHDADVETGLAHRALNTEDGATHAQLRRTLGALAVPVAPATTPLFTPRTFESGTTPLFTPRTFEPATTPRLTLRKFEPGTDAHAFVAAFVRDAIAPRFGLDDEIVDEGIALAHRAAFAHHDATDPPRELAAVDAALVAHGRAAVAGSDLRSGKFDAVAGSNFRGGKINAVAGSNLRGVDRSGLPTMGPTPNVVADVRAAVLAGDVSADDAAWLVRFAFVTAFVTTELAGVRMLAVLGDVAREVHAALRGEPSLRARFVAESLRVQSPVARFGRVAVEDVRVGDVVIPRGSRVVLSFAAANHDPRVFANPRGIDLARPAHATFAFGAGAHACLGARPARDILAAVLDCALENDVVAVETEALVSPVNRAARRARLSSRPSRS